MASNAVHMLSSFPYPILSVLRYWSGFRRNIVADCCPFTANIILVSSFSDQWLPHDHIFHLDPRLVVTAFRFHVLGLDWNVLEIRLKQLPVMPNLEHTPTHQYHRPRHALAPCPAAPQIIPSLSGTCSSYGIMLHCP